MFFSRPTILASSIGPTGRYNIVFMIIYMNSDGERLKMTQCVFCSIFLAKLSVIPK